MDACEEKGGTALMIAAQEGSDEMARILLGEGKCKRDLADKNKRTALHHACGQGGLKVFRILVEEFQFDPQMKDTDETSMLHIAVLGCQFDVFEYLLVEAKMDVNCQNLNGETPLHMAANQGNLQAIQLLLRHKCNTLIKDKAGRTALDVSIDGGHDSCVQALLEAVE